MLAFWLNFDADAELGGNLAPARPPPKAVACRLLRARVVLVPRSAHVLHAEQTPPFGITRVLCWMPTPSALAAIERLGCPPPPAPSLAVLRTVNSRRWSCARDAGPPGTRWVTEVDSLQRALASAAGDLWLRRAHGFAGRGRHIASAGAPKPSTLAFARAALAADGGFELAPRVEVLAEFALHGFVARDGGYQLGQPVRAHVDAHGQWRRASVADPQALTPEERRALQRYAARVAVDLREDGYFGPFGVDAMRWRRGTEQGFCVHEVNARYTMSWGLGMRGVRVDLQ